MNNEIPDEGSLAKAIRGGMQVVGGAVPFAGGIISAAAGAWSEHEQEKVNSFFPSKEEMAEMLESKEKEKKGFEKYGWKRWQGMELPNSFRNEEFYEDYEMDDNEIGVPSASKVPNGTKFTVAWGSEGSQWFTEGASSIPPEADSPFSSYKVWVAHEGIWELIEERDELESQARFYRIGAWH